jgi:hypothetical protein
MNIAVDFDGTLCEHRFPEIGEENSWIIKHLIELREAGHKLILWTCRSDLGNRAYLSEAIEWCRERGLEFDAHNENLPSVLAVNGNWDSRKIFADIYIDDRAALPNNIEEIIHLPNPL